MKKTSTILSILLLASVNLYAEQTAESLTVEKCGACHLVGKITKKKLKNMSAPPYWALAKKIKIAFPKREDSMNFFVDFTLNPTAEKMLFPKETRDRYGVMPSQKGLVSEEELKVIYTYVFGEKEK